MIMYIFRYLFLLICALTVLSVKAQRHSVILITIDGMRPEVITGEHMPSPFLKMMLKAQDHIYVDRVIGVAPSMTYPAHTSIITGEQPLAHGIHCNRVFQFNRDELTLYNMWADSIKVPTLWQWVKERGGTTASIFWPVSTGSQWIDYNVPEYYPTPGSGWQGGAMDFIRPVCTPTGLLEELEREATGRMTDATLRSNSFEYDAKTAYMTNYLVNTYRPDLVTVHLITTDYAQHETGLDSDRTLQAVASSDNAIGLILENLEYKHLLDSTTIIVCGDHGFTEARWQLRPNVLLTQAGLLSATPGGNWQCCFSSSGGASYLYLNPSLKKKQRTSCLKKVQELFEQQPDSIRSLYQLLSPDEIIRLGGDPSAALCLSTVAGTGCSNSRTGSWFAPQSGGYHGYMNGCDPTSLLIFGAGAKDPQLFKDLIDPDNNTIRQTDIAEVVKRILGTH